VSAAPGTFCVHRLRRLTYQPPRDRHRAFTAVRAARSTGEWDALLDEIQANLQPKPLAIHIPSKVPGATKDDEEMLRVVWDSLASAAIPLLPPV